MARLIDRLLNPQLTPEERVGLVQLYQSWQPGTEDPATSFVSYVREGYASNGVVFGAILARMMLLSDVRFRYRRLSDRELFGNSDLLILERPWKGGTTGEMISRMEQDASLSGNAYIHRSSEEDKLQRLRPDWVSIVTDGTEVVGYVYEAPGRNQVFIPEDEMAHWAPIPDPEAAYRGMSWLTPVAREILTDKQMTQHKQMFLLNAATPNMLVKVEGKLQPDVKDNIREEIARRYEGVENAYKTMLLEGGADATIIGSSLKQMDFTMVQAAGENRIVVAAGVPAIVVGIKEGLQAATYSNYGQAMRRFGDLTGRPLWRSLAHTLESVVNVPAGAELWYDTTDVVALRQDEKEVAEIDRAKASTIRQYVDSGFTPESAIEAVRSGDLSKLVHTGLYSVQLQPPGETSAQPDIEGEGDTEDE